MKKKNAIIFGISGQDGSYLANLLLKKKYVVIGITRNKSKANLKKLFLLNIINKVSIIQCKKINNNFLENLLDKFKSINEIYYLAGETSPVKSIKYPSQTFETNLIYLINILNFIKSKNIKTKFLYASSSEIFKKNKNNIFRENSEIGPRTPYAISKAAGTWIVDFYRIYHGIFCCSAILFNHESPFRSNEFVFKKIVHEIKKIEINKSKKIKLGNIKIKRDIGWAPEFVEAMWKMLQIKKATNIVIGTGKSYSIENYLKRILKFVNLEDKNIIVKEKKYLRKMDLDSYKSNPLMAKKILNWESKVNINQIIKKLYLNEFY